MVDNLTVDDLGGLLYQQAKNMWEVDTWCSDELNSLTATATHAVISFPYAIKILGTRVECVNVATTGFVINLTDGTDSIATIVPTSSTSYVRAKASQIYAKDTRLHIQSDATAGVVAATARFMFHFVKDERKDI